MRLMDAVNPTVTYTTTNGNGTFGYTAGITKNAYLDSNAKSVGYAYLNGIFARYDGTFWKPFNVNTIVLSGDFVTQVSVNDIGGVSGNGLIYTGINAPFNTTYRIDTQFGITTWSSEAMNSINPRGNTTNICESRGMLLPLLNETQGSINHWGGLTNVPLGGTMGNANGVPSHPSGYTWTSSAVSYNTQFYWLWNGMNGDPDYYYDVYYIRCVR